MSDRIPENKNTADRGTSIDLVSFAMKSLQSFYLLYHILYLNKQ